MPDAGIISLAMSMGRTPQELLDALKDEPEYWQNRFCVYVGAGGR